MFWLPWVFLVLQKHRKNRCFGSILGLREKENIVNSVVLSLVGAENIVNYDVLSAFRNRSFRTWKGKNIVKYSVFVFLPFLCYFLFSGILQKTPFSLLQKHRKYHCFGFILGYWEWENIAHSVALSSVGVQNTVHSDVLGPFLNASFGTRQAKNMVKYSVLVFSLSLCSIFVFSLAAKTSYIPWFWLSLWAPEPPFHICAGARARAPNESVFGGLFGAQARAARVCANKTLCNSNNNNNNINININNNNNNNNNPTPTHTLFPGTAGGCVSAWIFEGELMLL